MSGHRRSLFPVIFASLCLGAPLLGQVVVQDMYSAGAAGDGPTDLGGGVFGYEIDLDPETEFSAAGHGKLVMVYSGHDGSTGNGTTSVTSVTFDGVPLTEAIQAFDNGNLVNVGIYFLDDVATDGTLRIELASDTTVHYGFGLYAVDGLQPGVQDTGSGRQEPGAASDLLTDATVTMTTDAGFFVQESARNNQSLGDDPDDEYETLYYYNVDSYRGLSQYRVTTAPGDYLAPIGNTGTNFRRVVTAAFEGIAAPPTDPRITSITPRGSNLWELALRAEADTDYEFYYSPTLGFDPGTLVENLGQADAANDPGTVGGATDSTLTTDSNGDGLVRMTLPGDPVGFVRAQFLPPPPPLFAEDFEEGDGGFTTDNKGTGTDWADGAPDSSDQGGGAVTGGNDGSTNAWGTNLTGGYAADTNACLRSPVIDLTGVTVAELSFALSLDAQSGHTNQVDVIEAGSTKVIANLVPATGDGNPDASPWETVGPIAIPALALGQQVRIQWTFVGDGDGFFNGAYIDDVLIEETAP